MTLVLDAIPSDLRNLDQWVLWQYQQRGGDKPTKVPMQTSGQLASATDPATWTSFGAAIESDRFDGIGFVFAPENGMVGIDLDDSLEDGKPKPWAQKIIAAFDTYTEVSPSGNGVKMWCKGKYPGDNTGGRRKFHDGMAEMYWRGRYFTVTGQKLEGTSGQIKECQSLIDLLYRRLFMAEPVRRQSAGNAGRSKVDQCMRYLERCPDAISGNGGHDATLRAACECFRFGLSESEVWTVMQWWNGSKCRPQWSDRELNHKIDDAEKKVHTAGEFDIRSRQVLPPTVPIEKPPETSGELLTRIEEMKSGKRANAMWPNAPILSRMSKSLMPGASIVLCGGGGSTKSLWMSQACIGWLGSNVPFAVFHLEDDRAMHLQRALAQVDGNSQLTDDEWVKANPDEVDSAYAQHMEIIDLLGACIWDAPAADVSLYDLTKWIAERAAEGRRIIAVDPVTVADSGSQPWIADKKFILESKRLMREYDASLVLVTHPRDSSAKGGTHLDNMAGGKAYNRFTETVLWLDAHDDEDLSIRRLVYGQSITDTATINRQIKIIKARHAPGRSANIGYYFDSKTLLFEERGVVLRT